MSGTNIVFDTNTLINFFKGHPGLQQYTSSSVFLSIVTVLEFLSYPNITPADEALLSGFLKKVALIDLTMSNTSLFEQVVTVRKTYKLKLPDAIIAATGLVNNATVVTNDTNFPKVVGLSVATY